MIEHGLWRNPLAEKYRADGLWTDEILTDCVREWVATRGEATALVEGDTRLSWEQLWTLVIQWANALEAEGVAPGDVVSTQLPNGIDIVVLHLAIELIGAIHNPLAVQLREHELDQISGLLNTRLVIFSDDTRADFSAIHRRTQAGKDGRARDVATLRDAAAKASIDENARWIRMDATGPAFILNTSGTVAMKGVIHTHENAMYGTRVVGQEIVDLRPGDAVLCVIPMTWGGGLEWGLRLAMHNGSTLVTIPKWEPEDAIRAIERESVRFLYGPPTIAADLIRVSDRWKPTKPLTMICAGAPIPRQMVTDARELLGLALLPGYGQTEHFHSALARPTDSIDRIISTDGRAMPGVEIRIIDSATGMPVGPDIIGEIECRGPNVSAGYWNQPELTEGTFREDGWQQTQDLGSLDAEGYLRVGGRKRDIIIRGGLNVSPRELEELLLKHPAIRETAVVGKEDPRYGERVVAFVVLEKDGTVDIENISAFLSDLGVARFKHPEEVRILESLPLTATGKVWPQALRQLLGAS